MEVKNIADQKWLILLNIFRKAPKLQVKNEIKAREVKIKNNHPLQLQL